MTDISILGCGWLGMPLGRFMVKKGFNVKGSSTQMEKMDEIEANGMKPFHIHFGPDINPDFKPDFFKTDVLYINIPPGRKNLDPDYFLNIIRNQTRFIKKYKIPKVVFVSSTSVYPDINDKVSEEMEPEPDKASGKVLMQAERAFLDESSFGTNIIRFGGLIGGDRKPGRFLAGKRDIPNAGAPVNLIHLDDCLQISHKIITSDLRNEIFNACMPDHPTRKEFYTAAADKNELPGPQFNEADSPTYKIVDSSKLMTLLNYKFKHLSPLDCI